ncbi:MAG TPA: alpha/beta family hydrolase [Rudaea sp.]
MTNPQPVAIRVSENETVSGLLSVPEGARVGYVLAHGAGAGMQHAFMADLASALAARGIATLRYQFPYMEKGGGRPDSPKLAHATVRAACAAAAQWMPGVTLVAGGKSFGGRMTSQAQAAQPLEGVAGLIFVGFPLHPAKQPSIERAKHLAEVRIPMLFLQGTRDELANLDLITGVVERLDDALPRAACKRATLATFDDADHSFHVRKRSGSTDQQVLRRLAEKIAEWTATL